jgi:DNA-binding LacI/PurR family transcriptional regulator
MAGLRERGATLPMDLVRITGDINIAPSMRLVDELLDLRAAGRPEHQFTLLGCYNDFIARYAIERIRARGLRVPEDIGVAGYDDVDPAPSPGSRLTTVHLPIRELGMAAVRRLHTRLLHPGEPPLHWLLQTHVIEGNSVIRREMR